MRILKTMSAVLLLAAVGWAQSSSSSGSNGSGQTDASQNPPLTEQPKPTDAELNKPKAATFDVSGATQADEDQLLGEFRLMDRYTEINGDPTRSFRIPGSNNLAEFNLFVDRKFFHTNHRFQFLGMYRGTDDSSIDPERNSLQKGYIRIFSPRDEYIIGDALINYSRLTFNQNIKGFSLSHLLGEKWKVSAVSGVFIDRWGTIYNTNLGITIDPVTHLVATVSRPYLSFVGGARLERTLWNKDSKIGWNYSSNIDELGSVPTLPNGATPVPGKNYVTSMDSRFSTKWGLRFDGEYAYSWNDFDRRFAPPGLANICYNGVVPTQVTCSTSLPQGSLNRNQGDYGVRMEGSYRYKRFSLRSSFIRYQPNFSAANARQIADLQEWLIRGAYELASFLSVDGTVRRSNNDLRKQLDVAGQPSNERILWSPEMKFIFHDLSFYKRAVFEIGYRHRDTHTINPIGDSRVVRIPYVEANLPVKQLFFTIGYERRQSKDFINVGQTSNANRFYGGIRGIFDWDNWEITPTLRYELERTSHRPNLGQICTPVPGPATTCVPPIPVNPTLTEDSNRTGSIGLYIQAPKYFIIEAQFRDASATITSLDPIILPPAITVPAPAPNGYSRPAYKGAVTYKIRNDENFTFTFAFERNNNYYQPVAAGAIANPGNYDERIWSGTLMYRFGRKNR